MANQDTHEMDEAKLAPSEDGQRPIMVQYDTSPDPDVGPREEALERQGDQEERQDPCLQDNPQPQDPNQVATPVKGNNIFHGLSFPRKLWRIVEDDTFSSVCWDDDGDTVIIDENLFQREILSRSGEEQIFETKSLKSFICLLNHHGFSKIRPGNSSVCSSQNRMMIYSNCNFQRGKPWLLENITTQGNQVARICPETSVTPAKRKKQMAPTDKQKVQEAGKNDWGPNATQAFEFSVPQPMGSAREVQCPSEASGSSGEGTSGSMFMPTATAGTDGTGDLPPTPRNEPLQGSMMSLYNICYLVLMAGLSATAPPEDSDQAEEEEHEASSDDKCSLDNEQFKDSAGP